MRLILHRKWLENAYANPNYCDFKEGYNRFAIDNENGLAEIIRKDPDTSKIVENAKRLMIRHIKSDWSYLIKSRISKVV
jgi:hypothetical protein